MTVLATKGSDESWTGEILNISHNAVVESEAQRIRKEHPGEDAVIARDRVLSAIAVTRGT
jgi:pyruvate dehydrogenase phosphatase